MSDVKVEEAKPAVEEPVKIVEETPVVAEAAPAIEAPVEEKKEEEAKEEVKPISGGYLEFKPPGFLHSLIASKRYFYFSEDAFTLESLATYLKKDKTQFAPSNAAFATQTGKGLLFFTKTEAQKAAPTGIFKLHEITEVIASGTAKFTLKFGKEVVHFESIVAKDRDNWVETIKAKVEEAKKESEAVLESEGYKATLEKLSKPAVKPTVSAKDADKGKAKEEEIKEEPKEEFKEETAATVVAPEVPAKDEKLEKTVSSSDEEGKKVKRTPSNKGKRTSFLNTLSFRKDKEAKAEEKPAEVKEEPAAEGETVVAVPAETVAAPAAVPAAAEEVKPAVEAAEATKTKRQSRFGGFFDKKTAEKKEEPKEESTSAAEEAKTEEVKETADVVPETAEADKTEEARPAPVAKESFLAKFLKPKDKSEKTGVAAPKEAAPELEVAKDATKEETPAEAGAPAAEAPATETAAPAVETTSEATAEKPAEKTAEPLASPTTSKRLSTFLPSFKKEKKEEVKSDSEDAEAPVSPTPKKSSSFSGFLNRSLSKAKGGKKDEAPKEVVAAPETVAEEKEAAPAEASAAETTPAIEAEKPAAATPAEPVTAGTSAPKQVEATA